MRKLLRGMGRGLLAALMCVLLGGCGVFKPIDSLYALPVLPEEYAMLQTGIQTVMDELGAEYATISYGSNTSTIQLLDMDGDGSQEMVAVFLRIINAEEKPLRVCLFRQNEDGSYHMTHMVQGDGMSIHSVAYEDLTGDGVRELIVSWQMSARVHTLSAYQVTPSDTNELMSTSYNERYLITDLDKEGGKEILVFQQHSTDTESNRAEYYRYQDGVMMMAATAPLSDSMVDVTEAWTGRLSDGGTGVYVTCAIEGGVLTDILTLKEGNLSNVTRDSVLGVSQSTLRAYTDVGATDINRDGITEIPLPVPLPSLDPENLPGYYAIYWRQFDSTGGNAVVGATYHAVSDGWYFSIPSDWLGKITVGRDDSRSFRGERAVIFYYLPDGEESTPRPFLTIYRLTGENRFSRAAGRTILYRDASAIYCASLNTDVWDCGLEAAQLSQRFNLITTAWSTQ